MYRHIHQRRTHTRTHTNVHMKHSTQKQFSHRIEDKNAPGQYVYMYRHIHTRRTHTHTHTHIHVRIKHGTQQQTHIAWKLKTSQSSALFCHRHSVQQALCTTPKNSSLHTQNRQHGMFLDQDIVERKRLKPLLRLRRRLTRFVSLFPDYTRHRKLSVYMYVCMYVRMYVCMYVCMYMYIYVYMIYTCVILCVCVCVCVCTLCMTCSRPYTP